jgi:hypothetical protein
MMTLAPAAPDSLAALYAVRERVKRRLDDATPYSPDWAAASDYADEIDAEIAERLSCSGESD